MMTRPKLCWLLAAVVLFGLSGLTYLRWEAWFGNPPELPYEAPSAPARVLLTFGTEGETSRYVSWMCGTEVDSTACLLLADNHGDTVHVSAEGEVFVSRAGQAAYYRALLSDLCPGQSYHYAVETAGKRSPWYCFRLTDPKAEAFSFLYVGDVQDTLGGITNQLLRRAVVQHPEVEFVAFGGDLIERPTDAYWAETFRSIDSICTTLPVLNITGNHDYLKYLIRHCERRFALVFPYFLKGMAERDDLNHLFRLTYHNADLLLLDSDRGAPFLWAQRLWLRAQLERSRAMHRIVLVHHPLYSVKRANNNMVVRWLFDALLRSHGVDLVLQAHEHAYARCTASEEPMSDSICTRPPLYLISHNAPKTYKVRPTARFSSVLREGRYYQVITVRGEKLEVRTFDAVAGTQVDKVIIVASDARKLFGARVAG